MFVQVPLRACEKFKKAPLKRTTRSLAQVLRLDGIQDGVDNSITSILMPQAKSGATLALVDFITTKTFSMLKYSMMVL